MTGSIVCCCSSPDCMVNGCARYRQMQQQYGHTEYFQAPGMGWICPNCKTGVAPHLNTCPVCCPVQSTFTKLVITSPNFEDEGENHERSKDFQITQDPTEEDQG